MDKNKKSQAIKEISEEKGIEQDMIVKKMSSLRKYYGQMRQIYLPSKNKSDSTANEIKKLTWPYFDSLFFLNESLTAHYSTINLNLSNSGSDFIDINTLTASTPRNPRKRLIATMLHNKVNFKVYDVTGWLTNIYNIHIALYFMN